MPEQKGRIVSNDCGNKPKYSLYLTEILPKLKGIDFNPCEYDIPGYQAFYGLHRKRGTTILVKVQLKSSSKEEQLIFHEFEESVWLKLD